MDKLDSFFMLIVHAVSLDMSTIFLRHRLTPLSLRVLIIVSSPHFVGLLWSKC